MVLLSVIIPVFNSEAYLRDCLQSIRHQSSASLEVICVDDGSTDRSAGLLQDFARTEPRAKLISIPHSGLGAARNAGLREAQGDYVQFLDSDDTLEPNALVAICDHLVRFLPDLLLFDAVVRWEDKPTWFEKVEKMAYYRRRKTVANFRYPSPLAFKLPKGVRWLPTSCLMTVKRTLLIDQSIEFPVARIMEDSIFTTRCTIAAQRVDYLPSRLYGRRIRAGSITTSSHHAEKATAHIEAACEIWDLLSGGAHHAREQSEILITNHLLLASREIREARQDAQHIEESSFRSPRERVVYKYLTGQGALWKLRIARVTHSIPRKARNALAKSRIDAS